MAVQLLGMEDPAVKDALSSNPLPALLAGTTGCLQMEAEAQLTTSQASTAVSSLLTETVHKKPSPPWTYTGEST